MTVTLFSETISQAPKSRAGTTVLMVLLTSVVALTFLGRIFSSSRITWSFARDDALMFSAHVGKIDSRQGVPIWALCFNAFCILAIGCIYLGSTIGKPFDLLLARLALF